MYAIKLLQDVKYTLLSFVERRDHSKTKNRKKIFLEMILADKSNFI